ncbi:MAG TPA: accessory gene regulator B family protein [Bacilli bacterium]|nr:accessory gene regulator B family protein [Bacilli bacterium]
MVKEVKNKKKKRKNGIWFSDSARLDAFATEKAEKLQKTIENIIFYGITIPIQLFQTAGVVAIAIFNDAFPALSFFLIGFFFTRSILGESFHLNSTVMCTTMTWIIFFIVTAIIPDIYVSVFLSLLLGVGVSVVLHYIVVKDEEKCHED